MVAAMVAAQSKEIPMTKAKSNRKPASRANDRKTKTRNSVNADDRAQGLPAQARSKAAGSSATATRVAADCTPRKQTGSHHCNVASARWRDHRGDGTCSELATPFGPWLPRWCRAQEARPHSSLGRRQEWARLPDYGSRGVSGGVVRCGQHDRLQRRQPECR